MRNKYFNLAILLFSAFALNAQINIAPSAVASHSPGGTAGTVNYSATNYNDGVIVTGTFGWVTGSSSSGTSAWIEFNWPSSVTFDQVVIYPNEAGNRNLTGATFQMWDGSTWVTFHSYTVSPPSTIYSEKFSPVTTNRFRITNFIVTGTQSSNPSIREIEIFLNKLGVDNASTLSVDYSNSCAGNQTVSATVGNFGNNVINSLNVNWSINGFLQTPVSISTPLDTIGGMNPSQVTLSLGTHTLVAGNVDNIEVWTSLPNGNPDPHTFNDSLIFDKGPALAGNYTIDPAGSGITNYLSFTAAVNELNEFGVCGPVVFDVAGGLYPEQLNFGAIEGASTMNTIKFRADANNVTPVDLSFSGTSTDNYVVRFNNGSHITFEGITFTSTGTYCTALRFENKATNNVIKDCEVLGPGSATTSNNSAMIFQQGSSATHNTFKGNHIMGGSYGIYYRGNSTSDLVKGIVFDDNFVENSYYMGAYLYNTDSVMIRRNKVSSISGYGTGYGIYSYYGYNGQQMIGNEVLSHGLTWPYYGIMCYYAQSGDTAHGVFANNMVHTGSSFATGSNYGIAVYGPTYMDATYNTVVVESSGTSSRAGYIYSGTSNTFYNNVMLNYGNGYSIYALNGNSFLFDNNDIATNGTSICYYGGNIGNFAAWQALGYGANSINVNNVFPNPDSLRTCDTVLYNKGRVVGMKFDFDGDPRKTTTPNIGADEYIADAGDFSIGDTVKFCGGDEVEIGGTMNGGTFVWSTNETTPTIIVTQEGTYSVSVDGPCTTGMTDDVFVQDVNPVANFTINEGEFIGGFTNTSKYGTTYHWDFGDGSTSTQENPWHKYANNGPYTVILTVMNYCDTVQITKTVQFSVGVNEITFGSKVNIYPNPANSFVNVAFGDVEDQSVQVEMFDMKGQRLYNNLVKVTGNSVETLDISTLTKGVYLVKLTTGSEVTTKQIVVQ